MKYNELHDNRRNAYRVHPWQNDLVLFEVYADDLPHIPSDVVDVTATGASLMFDLDAGIDAEVGEHLDLRVHLPNIKDPLHLSGLVVLRESLDAGRLLHLFFEENQELIDRDEGDLFQLFNRRATFRGVQPTSSHEVKASAFKAFVRDEPEQSFALEICNVSTTGLRVRMDRTAHTALVAQSEVRISISFPEQDDIHEVVALIRYRNEEGDFVDYGCEFDLGRSENSLDFMEDLNIYLFERLADEVSATKH